MFDASTWDSTKSIHIIKDMTKMVKGHYACIIRMYKPLAAMVLMSITTSKNSYILGPIFSGLVSNHALCLYYYQKNFTGKGFFVALLGPMIMFNLKNFRLYGISLQVPDSITQRG